MYVEFKMSAREQMHRSLALLISGGPKLGENSKIQNVLKVGPVDKKIALRYAAVATFGPVKLSYVHECGELRHPGLQETRKSSTTTWIGARAGH
jgi:hypothetical protein